MVVALLRVEDIMKHDQLKILSACRDVNCADFCVVTPRGRVSLCILKFFRSGSTGAIFSVDIVDENGGGGDGEVDQDFLLCFIEFIEGSIFREFHGTDPGSIHSMEVSWGSLGLRLIKYYGERIGSFFETHTACAPASFRVN